MDQMIGAKKTRLISLDVLRGLTIAGMILVNDGAGKETFEPLKHAAWNGMSIADFVFPFFLFMVGISTYISLRKFKFEWSAPLAQKILKRTLVILLIGWGIYWFESCCQGDFLPFDHLRIPGVLHRIALSYGIVALLAVSMNHKWLLWLSGFLLIGYTILLLAGDGYACGPENILGIVDQSIFGDAHLYHSGPIDPEGLLGLIPSIAHTIIGFWCGKLLFEHHELKDKMLHLLLFGFTLTILGFLFSYGLPLNKRIWSPTFVLVTCGLATSLLALLIYLIDDKGSKQWTPFFVSFGVNPLFLYVFSELLGIVFSHFGIKKAMYGAIHSVIINGYCASLCYAVIFVLICWVVAYPLYKKKIYIKI
jgi:predicted acyltransferase